jgi:phosphohistidine phosphatase
MKTLCLLRHGHAGRGTGLQDFDRPLSVAGVEAASRVTAILRAADLLPDLVFCSSAERAQQTWEALASGLNAEEMDGLAIELREDLYLASEAQLLVALRAIPDAASRLLLIAHNPGLHRLARALAGPSSQAQALARLGQDFPPAGLAVLTYNKPGWAELSSGQARLTGFFEPV